MFSFFFLLYHSHPTCHSFPTRRSSDLKLNFLYKSNDVVRQAKEEFEMNKRLYYEINPMLATNARILRIGEDLGIWDRSEEHTSELQSRPHLVCRLLLEKKKAERRVGRN